jgi:hypothetical protein
MPVTAVTKSVPLSEGQAPKPLIDEIDVIYIAMAVLLFGAALWSGLGNQVEHTDFSMTYVGARIVHLGQSSRLYDLQEQIAVRESTFKRPTPLLFEHPPFEALIFSPLAALPYRTAYLIWALINALVWLALPFILRPYAPAPRETLAYLALWLLFAPLGVALFQGQSSILLLLLYVLCFVQLKQRRDLAAGILLGLGLFKFQFVLPLTLIFLLRRQWRFLAGFSLSGAFLGALSLVAVGWKVIFSYERFLSLVAGDPHNASYGNAIGMATVQGFFNAVLGPYLDNRAIGALVALTSLGLIIYTARRWQRLVGREDRPQADDLMFAGAVAVSLATGFHMFTHDFSPLALSLFLMAAHFPRPRRRALRYFMGLTLALFWTPPLYFGLLAEHSVYLIFPLLMAFAFGAFVLAGEPSEPGHAAVCVEEDAAVTARQSTERIIS